MHQHIMHTPLLSHLGSKLPLKLNLLKTDLGFILK